MVKNKLITILIGSLFFLFLGCAHQGPSNITNNVQYEQHSNWCLNYGTINKTPVYTESYRQCMERFGYKYETP